MITLKNDYIKPLPIIKKAKLKRNQPSFKFGIAVGMLLASIIIMSGKYIIDNYTFRSPIILKFRSPILRNNTLNETPKINRKPIKATPIPSKKKRAEFGKVYASEPELQVYHIEIYDKVRILESSGGKAVGLNAYCMAKGMVNSIGYSPSTKHCFKDQYEEKQVFSDWFTNKFDRGFTTEEAICYWNTGIRQSDCQYYKNYLTI